jgi:lipopolysaccharide export system protein LptC
VKLSSTRLFPLLLVLTLALLTFWLERLVRVEPQAQAQRRHAPDYAVERFTLVEYSREGAPVSTLSAAKMVHFPDDDSTELLAPHAMQTRPGEPRLTLSADRGTLSQNGNEMFLFDNVLMLRDGLAGQPDSRLRTSFLHLISDRSLVRSDREVQVAEQGRSLVARGMEYDNQARQLALHAQVRSVFDPKLK